jgi:hypothetical protein
LVDPFSSLPDETISVQSQAGVDVGLVRRTVGITGVRPAIGGPGVSVLFPGRVGTEGAVGAVPPFTQVLGRVIRAVDPDPKAEVLVEARMLVAPQHPPTAPPLALVRSRLDDARSPWDADGLVSVGVGSGLAVFMVQASPRPPEAETPTPPVQVG